MRSGTKQADVVRLLSRAEGATLHMLTRTTGWLPHTVRALLTRLRQRGLAVERDAGGEGREAGYRVAR